VTSDMAMISSNPLVAALPRALHPRALGRTVAKNSGPPIKVSLPSSAGSGSARASECCRRRLQQRYRGQQAELKISQPLAQGPSGAQQPDPDRPGRGHRTPRRDPRKRIVKSSGAEQQLMLGRQ